MSDFFAEPDNSFQIQEEYILKYPQFLVLLVTTATDMILLNLIYITIWSCTYSCLDNQLK